MSFAINPFTGLPDVKGGATVPSSVTTLTVTDDLTVLGDTLIGVDGVVMTGSGGILTITGTGTGADESLLFDFNTTVNQVGISSGSSVTLITFGTLALSTTGLLSGGVVIKTTATGYTIGATNAAELYGGVIYVTSAATITIPAVAVGASFTVVTIGAIAVSVDPNNADLIYLNGTALSDGDKITNASTAGDIAVFTYYDATGWYASTNTGWTDGN